MNNRHPESKSHISIQKDVKDIDLIERHKFLSLNSLYKVKKKPKKNKKNIHSKRDTNIWFVKNLYQDTTVFRHLITQEFFRLIIPGQPKTRVLKGELDVFWRDKPQFNWLMTKGVEGFEPISKLFFFDTRLQWGWIKGLGEITTVSLVVNDTDLNSNNVGLDNANHLRKIDSDYSFFKMIQSKNRPEQKEDENEFKITPESLRSLPNKPNNYPSLMWLTNLSKRRKRIPSPVLTEDLSNNPHILHEKHHACLKMLILPEELIRVFISCNDFLNSENKKDISERDDITEELIKRLRQLRSAALEVESFREYLLSELAKNEFNEYLAYLKDFKIAQQQRLLDRFPETEIIATQFHNLRDEVKRMKVHI